jgi:O-antigen ligase
MLYLTIAEEMGLVGLGVFLIAVGSYFAFAWRTWQRMRSEGADDRCEVLLLGLTAAVAGALVGGVFDHYLFNLEFPHAVSLFWMFIGLAVSVAQIQTESPAEVSESSPGSGGEPA